MADIDRYTGQPLQGFEEVEQSLELIFSTPQGVRVMREWFGNPGLKLLGENATERNILLWFSVVWALVELFEPRFRIKRFAVNEVNRLGYGDFEMVGEYRPYAHLDWKPAKAFVAVDNAGNVRVSAAV